MGFDNREERKFHQMIATDRKGREYKVGDIVQMCDFPILAKSMLNIPLEIVQIIPIEHCESGHNIVVKNLSTGEVGKPRDTNWYQPIKKPL
jgi:hypothetical protein